MTSRNHHSRFTRPPGSVARVETGTFEHQGQSFSALGSVVDHERGVVVAYPKGNELRTWDGQVIGTCRAISRTKNRKGVMSSEIVSYRAVIDGMPYHGRGGGDGMILKLRRVKTTAKRRRHPINLDVIPLDKAPRR